MKNKQRTVCMVENECIATCACIYIYIYMTYTIYDVDVYHINDIYIYDAFLW